MKKSFFLKKNIKFYLKINFFLKSKDIVSLKKIDKNLRNIEI